MNEIDLKSFDLNLIKAFLALERERSVTQAAQRLAVGQPAMSHALARLRKIFDDALFVRDATGMTPTPRALELVEPLRSALAQIEAALQGKQDGDPGLTDTRYRIGMTDVVAAAIIPRLSAALQKHAPSASIAVRSADRYNSARLLDDNELDLAIGLFPTVPAWQLKEPLFEEDFVCVLHPKQIKARRPLTLKQFASHAHVLVSLQNDELGFVDSALAKAGLERRVAITSPFFLLAGYLLHRLPLIATLPRHYAELCTQMSDVTISELPFASPRMTISMVWHRRNDKSRASLFLRKLVSEVVEVPTGPQ